MSVNIEKHRCPQNHRCPAISVCKFGALSQEGFNAPTIDEDKCTDCGKCSRFCPMGALQAAKKNGVSAERQPAIKSRAAADDRPI